MTTYVPYKNGAVYLYCNKENSLGIKPRRIINNRFYVHTWAQMLIVADMLNKYEKLTTDLKNNESILADIKKAYNEFVVSKEKTKSLDKLFKLLSQLKL